ncbi:type II toxin-antitoxin system RelE/ParE family toxin [Corynebacterium aurimucosum]|uniref:type II toxin-antitoxin system RelE/ParE family toxin n=1 Tax=Corynebacterium aurimucosum TaxID=169292 RepID=UPI000C1C7A1C
MLRRLSSRVLPRTTLRLLRLSSKRLALPSSSSNSPELLSFPAQHTRCAPTTSFRFARCGVVPVLLGPAPDSKDCVSGLDTRVKGRHYWGVQFRRRSLERFHQDGVPPRYIPSELRSVVRRKLLMIGRSVNVTDLRIPPANRLERLKGDLEGYYSIRVNSQWRIIFKWTPEGAVDVDFIDYH